MYSLLFNFSTLMTHNFILSGQRKLCDQKSSVTPPSSKPNYVFPILFVLDHSGTFRVVIIPSFCNIHYSHWLLCFSLPAIKSLKYFQGKTSLRLPSSLKSYTLLQFSYILVNTPRLCHICVFHRISSKGLLLAGIQ